MTPWTVLEQVVAALPRHGIEIAVNGVHLEGSAASHCLHHTSVPHFVCLISPETPCTAQTLDRPRAAPYPVHQTGFFNANLTPVALRFGWLNFPTE